MAELICNCLFVRSGRHPSIARLALALCLSLIVGGPWAAARPSMQEKQRDSAEKLEAVAVLNDLVGDSKECGDPAVRARTMIEAADLIWKSDPARGAAWLRKSSLDVQSLARQKDRFRSLSQHLIHVSSKHDVALAAEFVNLLDAVVAGESDLVSGDSAEAITARGALLLDAANDLLEAGEKAKAIEFAQRSLVEGRSMDFFRFLTKLRKLDEPAVEGLFLLAVQSIRKSANDPNDLLLPAMWLFYPGRMTVGTLSDGVDALGFGTNFVSMPAPPTQFLQPLLEAAIDVLARFPIADGGTAAARSVQLRDFALRQFAPLLHRYRPLSDDWQSVLGDSPRPLESSTSPSGSATPEPYFGLSTSRLIEKIKELPTQPERDYAFFSAANQSIHLGDTKRSLTLVGEIRDPEFKEQAEEYVNLSIALDLIRQGEFDQAVAIMTSRLCAEMQSMAFVSLSAQLHRKPAEKPRIMEVGSLVGSHVSRQESSPTRALAYMNLVAGMIGFDSLRAFEFAEALVGDLNKSDGTKIPQHFTLKIRSKEGGFLESTYGIGNDVSTIFTELSAADFYRAALLANQIRIFSLRSEAVISTCRSVLSDGG